MAQRASHASKIKDPCVSEERSEEGSQERGAPAPAESKIQESNPGNLSLSKMFNLSGEDAEPTRESKPPGANVEITVPTDASSLSLSRRRKQQRPVRKRKSELDTSKEEQGAQNGAATVSSDPATTNIALNETAIVVPNEAATGALNEAATGAPNGAAAVEPITEPNIKNGRLSSARMTTEEDKISWKKLEKLIWRTGYMELTINERFRLIRLNQLMQEKEVLEQKFIQEKYTLEQNFIQESEALEHKIITQAEEFAKIMSQPLSTVSVPIPIPIPAKGRRG